MKEKPEKRFKKLLDEALVILYAAEQHHLILAKGKEPPSWEKLRDQFLKRYRRSPLFRRGLRKWKNEEP